MCGGKQRVVLPPHRGTPSEHGQRWLPPCLRDVQELNKPAILVGVEGVYQDI